MNIAGTIAFVCATIGAYVLSRYAAKRFPSPLTTPVFFSTAIIIAVLLMGGFTVADYDGAKTVVSYLLGPATVALAVPLYKHRKTLIDNLAPIGVGLFCGSVATMGVAVMMAKSMGLSDTVVSAMSLKSVTTAVAIESAALVHTDPSLAAVLVVMTGMFGAAAGPLILSLLRIRAPLARGLAFGCTAHGQGTAQALIEGELQGAGSSIAMVLATILVPTIAPYMLRMFG